MKAVNGGFGSELPFSNRQGQQSRSGPAPPTVVPRWQYAANRPRDGERSAISLREDQVMDDSEVTDQEADLLPDDDPDVVAGMERLRKLRKLEADIPEIGMR